MEIAVWKMLSINADYIHINKPLHTQTFISFISVLKVALPFATNSRLAFRSKFSLRDIEGWKEKRDRERERVKWEIKGRGIPHGERSRRSGAKRERMPSTYNRIRSPRFYQESMKSRNSRATSSSACYLITGDTLSAEVYLLREWTRRDAKPLAATCVPGVRKLRLECTWSPFWNFVVLYSARRR